MSTCVAWRTAAVKLDRWPDDPKPWTRAAEILRELSDAQVGVGPQPFTAAQAAEQAEREAAALLGKKR